MLETGTRSIDITAAIGDSVVAVHQLGSPRGGKISRATKALFVSAAVALACAIGSFAYGVSVAAKNRHALEQWVERDKLPAVEFRPAKISPLHDVLSIGGLVSALALVGFGLARVHAERRSPHFRIGRTPDAEWATDDVPVGVAAFPLIAPEGDRFVLSWAPGMKGEMFTGGRLIPLAEVPQGAPIPDDARIRIESGSTTFHITSSGARPAIGVGPMDGRVLGFAGISAAAHGLLLLLLFMMPDNVRSLSNDELDDQGRMVMLRSHAMEPPKPPEQMKADEQGADRVLSGDPGQKLAGESGTMGTPDAAKDAKGGYQMKNNGVPPTLSVAQARDQAKQSGILGAIRKAGSFSHVTGTSDFSSGLDDRDVYGGLIDGEPGVAHGNWGYGPDGLGPGGGGTGLNTVGTGDYGTIGRCRGKDCGKGPGWGNDPGGVLVASRRTPRAPKPEIGRAVLKGDVDASMIRQRIRSRLDRIQYCYERALVGNPALAGTVNTQFTIDGTGRVITMAANGVSDEVSGCVAEVIKGIQFPTGGQIVQVTSYPFRFTSPSATAMR